MRRIVATFDTAEAAIEAKQTLRDEDLEPEEPDIDNPFFDPARRMPERRGLLWGGILGGFLGAVLLFAVDQNLLWLPRTSPIMTAGTYMLVSLGFGLGAASGGFLGGAIGAIRPIPERDGPQITVVVPDHRASDTVDALRSDGAETVDDVVSHHEHPLREYANESPPQT